MGQRSKQANQSWSTSEEAEKGKSRKGAVLLSSGDLQARNKATLQEAGNEGRT